MRAIELSADKVAAAKRAFTTRRVPESHMRSLITGNIAPRTGDLVLAIVEKIGSHKRIEMPNGRKAFLTVGDTIIVCYGNRYAPDQFEAVIGEDLGPCELVAAGGVAAHKLCKHDRMNEPTRIVPLGLLGNSAGMVLNLDQYGIDLTPRQAQITTVFVAGTAMNAGKTYTSASLVHGFSRAGFKVAGIKSTGTGSGGDIWQMSDYGADTVLDFTDAGMPSTYLQPPDLIERGVLGLIAHAAERGCEVAVVEIADGLHHEETAALLRSSKLRHASRGLVFAANDALGAQAGLQTLNDWGWRVFALSGQLTRSPLAMREASRATGIPVLTAAEIQAGDLCGPILGSSNFKLQMVDKSQEQPRVESRPRATLAERIVAQIKPNGTTGPGMQPLAPSVSQAS
ncbi:MAG: hypothetical protein KJ622_17805 [Alphaproteobacteria bacterium]|nr:hypothetical protein [Alphaproteobacteria bacterium]